MVVTEIFFVAVGSSCAIKTISFLHALGMVRNCIKKSKHLILYWNSSSSVAIPQKDRLNIFIIWYY